jgi:hypothetical protein
MPINQRQQSFEDNQTAKQPDVFKPLKTKTPQYQEFVVEGTTSPYPTYSNPTLMNPDLVMKNTRKGHPLSHSVSFPVTLNRKVSIPSELLAQIRYA